MFYSTVTLSDGYTMTRRGRTTFFTHAVVVTTDLRARAQSLREAAHVLAGKIADIREVIADGRLHTLNRYPTNGNRFAALLQGDTNPHDAGYDLPDPQDPYSWGRDIGPTLDRLGKRVDKMNQDASLLEAGPAVAHQVASWLTDPRVSDRTLERHKPWPEQTAAVVACTVREER